VLLAERMRKIVSDVPAWDDDDLAVTLSVGVAAAALEERSSAVVARASGSMSNAKKEGGDRARAGP
jgi:GGDEF domain-containing protein